MQVSRRGFTTGALSAAFAGQFAGPAFARQSAFSGAIDAIRAYGEAHRRHFTLPGMTLGVTAPNGFEAVLNFGIADLEGQRPIGPETLFQIGSISKSMTSTVIHQFAAEGRLGLAQRVSDVLPAIPLPADNAVTIQHLLDHVAGLADSAPVFAAGGLRTAYPAGAHWHY